MIINPYEVVGAPVWTTVFSLAMGQTDGGWSPYEGRAWILPSLLTAMSATKMRVTVEVPRAGFKMHVDSAYMQTMGASHGDYASTPIQMFWAGNPGFNQSVLTGGTAVEYTTDPFAYAYDGLNALTFGFNHNPTDGGTWAVSNADSPDAGIVYKRYSDGGDASNLGPEGSYFTDANCMIKRIEVSTY